ncbi:MAG: response regulator [Elusimicrobia bacterium]|nr:response regulator [Elusimicrobiota bacterium]
MATIMVLDDDRALLDMMEDTLGVLGYEVVAFADPVQAWTVLVDVGSPVPDLLISDVMMPGIDGLTLTRRLMEDERLRSLKVLIVTAKPQLDEMFKEVPNVVGFIPKPFKIDLFRDTVAAALAKT